MFKVYVLMSYIVLSAFFSVERPFCVRSLHSWCKNFSSDHHGEPNWPTWVLETVLLALLVLLRRNYYCVNLQHWHRLLTAFSFLWIKLANWFWVVHWVGWRGGDSIRDQQLPEAPSHTPTNQLPTRIKLWLRSIVHFIRKQNAKKHCLVKTLSKPTNQLPTGI